MKITYSVGAASRACPLFFMAAVLHFLNKQEKSIDELLTQWQDMPKQEDADAFFRRTGRPQLIKEHPEVCIPARSWKGVH